jgi:hypothetical protein
MASVLVDKEDVLSVNTMDTTGNSDFNKYEMPTLTKLCVCPVVITFILPYSTYSQNLAKPSGLPEMNYCTGV